MKSHFKLLVFSLIILIAFPVLAQSQDFVEASDSATLIAYLTPIIVLAATWAFKKLVPIIPGKSTLIIVVILSGVAAWLTNLLSTPDISWISQVLLGLSATFINQLYRQFTQEE